jgi:hypothetical protein
MSRYRIVLYDESRVTPIFHGRLGWFETGWLSLVKAEQVAEDLGYTYSKTDTMGWIFYQDEDGREGLILEKEDLR